MKSEIETIKKEMAKISKKVLKNKMGRMDGIKKQLILQNTLKELQDV